MKQVTLGLEKLLANPNEYLRGNTLGLVVNQTSLTSDGQFSIGQFHNNKSFKLKTILKGKKNNGKVKPKLGDEKSCPTWTYPEDPENFVLTIEGNTSPNQKVIEHAKN